MFFLSQNTKIVSTRLYQLKQNKFEIIILSNHELKK